MNHTPQQEIAMAMLVLPIKEVTEDELSGKVSRWY